MDYFKINTKSFIELEKKYSSHIDTLSELIYNEFSGKHFTINELKNRISNIDFINIEKSVRDNSNNCISINEINTNCCLARVKHDDIFKQCSRKLKEGCKLCGIHLKNKDNLPYGLINEEFIYTVGKKKSRGRPKKNY